MKNTKTMKNKFKAFASILLLLTMGIGQVWGLQNSLVSGRVLPDIPSSTLNLASQTDFTPDGNGWIVFGTKGVIDSKGWASHGSTDGSSGKSWTAPSGTTAPFFNGSSAAYYTVQSGRSLKSGNYADDGKKTHAIRFTGAEKASFLMDYNSDTRKGIVSLFSYDGETQSLVTTTSTSSTSTEILFSNLSTSTTYIAYIYGTSDESNSTFYEVALKAPASVDTTAPTLSSSVPANGATNVAVSGNIVLTFSENVTINDASMFAISPSTGVTFSTPTVSGAAVTIPYSGLANSTIYTLSVAADAVKDGSNNKNAALSNISFTTVAATPVTGPTGDATVSFALNGSGTTGTVTGVNSISSLSTAWTLSTLTLTGTKDGYSGAIKGCTSTAALVETDYVDVQFTVANGYAFTPSTVSVKVNPFNGTGALKAVVAIQDASLDVRSEVLTCAKNTDNEASFVSGAFTDKEFEGTVRVRIYAYGAASDKAFYIKSPVEISGTIAAAPTKYDMEFAKGDEGATGSMTTAKYKEGETVTLPACGFTAPSGKEFDAWVVTKKVGGASVTITDGKITMPAETVVATATWKTAVSNDATLSDLKVGGTTVSGFAAATLNYYYELDYGFTSYPAITYTKNHDGANIVYQDASEREDDCSIVKVTAEDGTTIKQYIIHFYAAPKYGVELIKATHNGTATGATITGYIGGTADKLTQNGGKLGSADHYFGVKLANDEQFKAGDLVVIKASTISATVELFDTKTFTSQADSVAYLNKGNFDANSKMYTFTLENDANQLYLYRTKTANAQMNPTVEYIAVYRYMAPFIESFEIENVDLTINQQTKAITAEVASTFDVTALTPTIKAWANGEAQINKSGAQDFTNPVSYTVSSQYTEDATGTYAPVTYTVTITKVTPSATPTITTQPQGANYIEGATVAALTVVAEASDEGTLTYQWYLGEDAIDGATSATYTPTVSAIGSYSYTCVVTNTKDTKPAASVTSNAAVVVIASDPSCATFATVPSTSPYRYTNTGEWTIFNVNANGVRDDANAFDTGKDYANNNVNIFAKQRCAIIFAKDMQRVVLYTNNSNSREWASSNPVKVSADKDKFLGEAEGNPSYTAYAAATTMVNYDEDTKKVIFTAEGEFEANKVYLFNFSNSVNIFKICAVEADPEADEPVFSGVLSDEAVCPGDAFTTLDATAAPVVSYAWYKNNEVIEGATAATYTPTEAGTYYCIATNGGAGYRDNSLKSAEAVLSVNTATAITAHVDAKGDIGEEKTLSVTAEGTNLSYKWQACNENGVVTDETVLATTTTYGVTITEATQYFLITVEGSCGTDTQVVKAEKWNEYTFAHVTGTRTWDWKSSTAGWPTAENSHIDFANTGVEYLMANVSSQVPNNDEFRSDMLIGKGQYLWRNKSDGEYGFQGFTIKFYTEVAGQVRIYYRSPSSGQTSAITIDGKNAGSRGNSWGWSDYVLVGGNKEIEIAMTNGETGMTRVQKIEFLAGEDMNLDLADADYTRDITAGRYGTICLPKAGVMVGAAIFEVAYLDNNDPHKKIFFDEVISGEMVAGRPYIFLPNEGAMQLGVFYTDDTEEAAGNYRGLFGSYTQEVLATDGTNYILLNNQYCRVANPNTSVGANRAYFKIGVEGGVPTNAVAPAPGRRRVSMSAQGEQVATGTEETQSDNLQCAKIVIDGQFFILRGEKMYDATGRLVK